MCEAPSHIRSLLSFGLDQVLKFILLLLSSLLMQISFPIIRVAFSAIVLQTTKGRSWPRNKGA